MVAVEAAGLSQVGYTSGLMFNRECPLRLQSFNRALVPGVLALVLSACGTNPYSLPKIESPEPEYREPAPEPVPDSAPEVETGDVARPAATGAHTGLLTKAGDARNRGEYSQSLAYLERAQRIDPDNAEVYLGLAQTHAAAGNSAQARATAERGLLYCRDTVQCDALRVYTR